MIFYLFIGYLIWKIYLTLRIFIMREKLDLLWINLVSMPYVGGNEYNLIELDEVRTKFVHGQGWKNAYYQILTFGLWRNLIIYNTWLLLAKKFILELFWRAKYSTIKRRVACWRNIVFEEYVEVKKYIYRDFWGNQWRPFYRRRTWN